MGYVKEALWVLKHLSRVMVSFTSKERGHCLVPLFSSGTLEVMHFGNNKEGLEVAGIFIWLPFHCDPWDPDQRSFGVWKCREVSKRLECSATCFNTQQPLEIHTRACSKSKGSSKPRWFQYKLNKFFCRLSHIPILGGGTPLFLIYWVSTETWRI